MSIRHWLYVLAGISFFISVLYKPLYILGLVSVIMLIFMYFTKKKMILENLISYVFNIAWLVIISLMYEDGDALLTAQFKEILKPSAIISAIYAIGFVFVWGYSVFITLFLILKNNVVDYIILITTFLMIVFSDFYILGPTMGFLLVVSYITRLYFYKKSKRNMFLGGYF
jgi:hypothetical protein